MKFGGTSVSSDKGISRVVEIAKKSALDGNETVVVVSAMVGVTDEIIEAIEKAVASDRGAVKSFTEELAARHREAASKAVQNKSILEKLLSEVAGLIAEFEKVLTSVSYLKEATPRSRDYITSFGEKLSTSIVCAALQDANLKALWFTGGEAGIITDDRFGNATPLMKLTAYQVKKKLEPLISEGVIPVVTGFIAHTQDTITSTLGRGGSDYTATILGSALDADEVWIWTDVDGLMTADPKIVPSARTIPSISYSEAIEMAYFGARGMHPKALEPAADKEIPVRVKNTFSPEKSGTLIVKGQGAKSMEVAKAIAVISEVALITVSGAGMAGTPGVAAKVFGVLGENHINILMISQGSSEANISFIIPQSSLDKAVNKLELALLGSGLVREISSEKDACIIAVVGAGMRGTPGVAARVFNAVAGQGVNVRMIAQGSSELNISFIINEADVIKAVKALHKEFHLDEY
jgi:aspartate kinase